jgi:hypothetical protein
MTIQIHKLLILTCLIQNILNYVATAYTDKEICREDVQLLAGIQWGHVSGFVQRSV